MNKKTRAIYISTELIIVLVLLCAALLVAILMEPPEIRMAVIVVIFLAVVVYFIASTFRKERWFAIAAHILTDCSDKIDKYVNAVTMPTAIIRKNGMIGWHNPAFSLIAGMRCEGRSIFRIFPQLHKPAKDRKVKIGDTTYVKEVIPAQYNGKEYTVYRLIDVGNTYEASDLSRNVMIAVCHIQIDNYGDLLRGTLQSDHAKIDAEVDRIISAQAENLRGVYQKYDRDKYLLFFERRYLSTLMQGKFNILNDVKNIKTGNMAIVPTLSIGTGVGNAPEEANRCASAALELALGRGGDQAVIKDEGGYKFYGGGQQAIEKRTRIKARMFAHALKNLMEQCDKVVIMGHTVPDLDALGAALGIYACARQAGKKGYIVLDKPNAAVQGLVDEMKRDPDYKDVTVTPAEAERMMSNQTMLVVVDTQIESFVIAPELVERAKTMVVIDHHVRGTTHMETPTLSLYEPYASSTAEMVTEILEYFADKMYIKPLEVEALLAGIAIDTKGFSFKTGVRTFEAASYLRRLGADTTSIRHLFQDDLETFSARAAVVQNAEVLADGIAISWCPDKTKNPQLLAAQAADSLIGIRGINASFVLCAQGDTVVVSGRSIGGINVQRILEKLGGGGHATIAGAQLKGMNKQTADEKLRQAIDEYKKEN
ncbi:MAG: DHH family phosphoesterase [Christensenella sp.]